MQSLKEQLYIATFQDNAIEVASDYGVGLEINHTCISNSLDPENRDNLIAQIRADIAKSNTDNALLHGPFTELYPAAIDYRSRLMAKERLEEAFKVCQAINVNKMIVHTGWLPFIYFKGWQAEKGAQFWQNFMADKPNDFSIYIENVLEDEPYMLKDMMEQISDSRIKLCLDIGHANAMTSPDILVEEWIQVLSHYIGHFHLHNNDGTADSHGPFGEGSMNMNSIFNTIQKYCKQNVTFTVEARNCLSCMEWLTEHKYI